MTYGKIYTYKDVKEAKKLIGKKVVASDYLAEIDEPAIKSISILTSVSAKNRLYPFTVRDLFGNIQFIREVIEPEVSYKYKVGDRVLVLDGSDIPNYTELFVNSMLEYVGRIYKIKKCELGRNGLPCYLLEGDSAGFRFDERGLALVKGIEGEE